VLELGADRFDGLVAAFAFGGPAFSEDAGEAGEEGEGVDGGFPALAGRGLHEPGDAEHQRHGECGERSDRDG
jgi:hypothetical protein